MNDAVYDSTPTAGHEISGNLIENIGRRTGMGGGFYHWGSGIIVYNGFYADITDNTIVDVIGGVQTGNYHSGLDPAPSTASITDNVISAAKRGIFFNLMNARTDVFEISGNDIGRRFRRHRLYHP